MNANLTKLISSAVALVLAMGSSAFAQNNMKSSNPNCGPTPCPEPKQGCPCPPFEKTCPCPTGVCPCPPYEQGEPLTNCVKFPPAYNAPAAVDVQCSWDVFVSGSFIYWLTSQEGLDIGYNTAITAAGGTILPPNFGLQQTPSFTYEPGFKLGIGMDFDYDNWVGYLEYTWLHFTRDTSFAAPTDSRGTGVIALNNWYYNKHGQTAYLTNNLATSVSTSWNMRFDMIDATLSRPYYQGRSLTVTPYAGARTVWVRQNYRLSSTMLNSANLVASQEDSRNRYASWGMGPVAGALGHWLFGWGFRAEADMGASVAYTTYTQVLHREDSVAMLPQAGAGNTSVATKLKSYGALRPITNMGMGLGWGSYFDRQNYHLDISANYDFMVLWDQNMLRYLVDEMNSGSAAQPANLYFSGLTATVRFDF